MRNLNLENKPSDLLTQATQALQKASRSRYAVVDMSQWCHGDSKKCHLCLAGSLIFIHDDNEFTSTIKDGLDVNPTWYNVDTQIKLYTVNGLRLGRITETLREYGFGSEQQIEEFERNFGARRVIEKYNDSDPLTFYMDIKQLIDDLRSVGL